METEERKPTTTGPVHLQRSSQLQVAVFGGSNSPLPSPNERPISPLGDESVQGYLSDIRPSNNGAKQIVPVIEAIEAKGITCCLVAEAALIYYGAKRVMFDWLICVPTEHVDHISTDLKNRSDQYALFQPSAMNAFGSLNPHYPRFKVVGQSTFFIIMSSQACHLDLSPQNVEYDRWIHLPYPSLPVYVQSLLDTWNLTDLEDLIDGMNLSEEWGHKHLNLDGQIDQEWARWRETVLAEQDLDDDDLPQWSEPTRRIWDRLASAQAKKKRQGWKSRPNQLTRFWTSGQLDPRERYKDYS